MTLNFTNHEEKFSSLDKKIMMVMETRMSRPGLRNIRKY